MILHSFAKGFQYKHVLTKIKDPQANAQLERVHQVIINMLLTKDLYEKVFDHIYIHWVKTYLIYHRL